MECQAGWLTNCNQDCWENISNLRYEMLPLQCEEKLKILLMRVKEESKKASLELNIQKTKIIASGLISSWRIEGEKVEAVTGFIFLGSKITVARDCSHEIKRCLFLGRKADKSSQRVKSRDITLPTKVHIVKPMVIPVQMWESDHKESAKRIDAFKVLEKTVESPLDSKEIKPVNPKGNQCWIFIGRTVAEPEVPAFWPPDAKSWLFAKDLDAGKDWRQKEKEAAEDEMVR